MTISCAENITYRKDRMKENSTLCLEVCAAFHYIFINEFQWSSVRGNNNGKVILD